jgi:hypothetical protein
MTQAAIAVGRSPGAVLMEIEPACFRSLLTGRSTCVYAVELQRSLREPAAARLLSTQDSRHGS